MMIRAGLLLQGPPHKCALFFVDNSGVDIILGVMPFVRELLSRGTEVTITTCYYHQRILRVIKLTELQCVSAPQGCVGQQFWSSSERRNKQ